MFKRALVPVKASKGSEKAIQVACDMAAEFGMKVHILFIRIDGVGDSLSDGMIMRARTSCENRGIDVTFSEKMVSAPGEIAGAVAAASADHDLIIMGHCRYNKIYKFLHPSVAEEVINLAECPVLITAVECPDDHRTH